MVGNLDSWTERFKEPALRRQQHVHAGLFGHSIIKHVCSGGRVYSVVNSNSYP